MLKQKNATERISINLQLLIAVLLTLSGIVLLFSGFWTHPTGQIDSSVLVAFGETCTFAGALFGVDYSYKKAIRRTEHAEREESFEN
ncbi:hypothetical protein M2459_002739 [Parabacteroides sp. PF5-5]|uniref:hypothetical protein n=1 Tax=unclassified Parabacteroides TaxID=2649774 RepID=UPI0024758731|nr:MULTISPECIES: hypothetical protein [unclassified Parabacteroides]MDH6306117.1 hypothetical protein [Parabacteroides sp. PH5-39]MDH6316985.1 hypothetical protein [Parabacteroides sp. PF5-13]MDH6320738.1 hypothetical protein [Parabacteroides sp. PH5-13]MDH6324560.1 hypothetical protein [Parabacteroides sp. PH5-8]MDH6328170.1 hypothetical protein [Parabacteroides sp. PH5-41]